MNNTRPYSDTLRDTLCNDPEQAALYLSIALAEDGRDGFMRALSNIADAYGVGAAQPKSPDQPETDAPPAKQPFDFGLALVYIKNGYRMARTGWNGKGMFLFLVPGSQFTVNRPPLLGIYPEGTRIDYHAHIDMRTARGEIVPWVASQSDMLAEDWVIVATP